MVNFEMYESYDLLNEKKVTRKYMKPRCLASRRDIKSV
jgi:hypothetical protein